MPVFLWIHEKKLLITVVIATLLTAVVWVGTWIRTNKSDSVELPEKFPFMAFLYSVYKNNTQICGGTIITTNHILTAAHCIQSALEVSVLMGVSSIREIGEMRDSKTFIIHENYNNVTLDNDIGLVYFDEKLKLKDNVNLVQLLNQRNDFSCISMKVLGWGGNNTDGLDNEFLKIKPVTVGCKFENKNHYKLCTVDDQGPCHGDSGGPLLCEKFQIGIVSAGDKYCTAGMPVFYTDLYNYLNWILNKTEGQIRKDNLEKFRIMRKIAPSQ